MLRLLSIYEHNSNGFSANQIQEEQKKEQISSKYSIQPGVSHVIIK